MQKFADAIEPTFILLKINMNSFLIAASIYHC